jgi:ferredoxin
MISVNIDTDPHFRRIIVNEDKCTKCQLCIPSCPSAAFSDLNLFSYEADLCFGCSNCLEYCPYDALDFENWSASNPLELNRLFLLGASAFEIHLGKDLEALENFYLKLDLNSIKLESFSIGSEKMTDEELAESAIFIAKMTREQANFKDRLIIIQCDGIPQSGARLPNSTDKDLKSIHNANVVLKALKENNLLLPNIFVQIAGGVDDKSLTKAHALGVEIHGVAIGSWLRKKILKLDIEEAKHLCRKIINQSKANAKNHENLSVQKEI